jgi:hypothetical protein
MASLVHMKTVPFLSGWLYILHCQTMTKEGYIFSIYCSYIAYMVLLVLLEAILNISGVL